MATHSSILIWRIPRTEEPGRLQSIESQRVGHDRNDLAKAYRNRCGYRFIDLVCHVTLLITRSWHTQLQTVPRSDTRVETQDR